MCECQVCKDLKRWDDVIKNGDVYQRKELLEELYGRIEDAETEVEYYRALFKGTYPYAEEILTTKLRLIKENNASNLSLS
jgi:hypothetical protein